MYKARFISSVTSHVYQVSQHLLQGWRDGGTVGHGQLPAGDLNRQGFLDL